MFNLAPQDPPQPASSSNSSLPLTPPLAASNSTLAASSNSTLVSNSTEAASSNSTTAEESSEGCLLEPLPEDLVDPASEAYFNSIG